MYGNNRYGDGPQAPVSVGEELNVTIEAVGEKGDGIAKKNGFVLFVPNVKEGDNVRIKVNKVLKKVGFADVVGQAESGREEQAEEEPEDAGQESEEISEEDMANDSEDFGEDSSEGEADEEMSEDDQPSEEDEEKQ